MGPENRSEIEDFEFEVKKKRPEEQYKDPFIYYTEKQVAYYARSKSLMTIQERLVERAIKLAALDPPASLLDVGMGCGHSTAALYLRGFDVAGIDIHFGMISYLRNWEFNPVVAAMQTLPFRPRSFDGIISVSAVQWLFGLEDPDLIEHELNALAKSINYCLKPGGKVAIQFYPKNDQQIRQVGGAFVSQGNFEGGYHIDSPESPKKRRIFLILEKEE